MPPHKYASGMARISWRLRPGIRSNINVALFILEAGKVFCSSTYPGSSSMKCDDGKSDQSQSEVPEFAILASECTFFLVRCKASRIWSNEEPGGSLERRF
jgi:hypothetical protein